MPRIRSRSAAPPIRDSGPSLLSFQVVALWLRSGAKVGEPALEVDEEMDYAVTLNRALPDDIRVLGWTPVPETFSARCLRLQIILL